MGTQYDQLCQPERMCISRLYREGCSYRQIAAMLNRAPSTISREIRRNSQPSRFWPAGRYDAQRASELTRRRRRRGRGHKLARQHRRTIFIHESIYRFVYFRTAQKDYWNRLLPRR